MAQWAARGDLVQGDIFIHESIIGSIFKGRIESQTRVGNYEAILPSVEGWARIHGLNTIFIDGRDPFVHGFTVT
jgi:4-hydroxyproline epimerase